MAGLTVDPRLERPWGVPDFVWENLQRGHSVVLEGVCNNVAQHVGALTVT